MNWSRIGLALALPLLLTSCILTPGRFTSALDIKADRSFAFTYVGEVIRIAPDSDMASTIADAAAAEEEGADEASEFLDVKEEKAPREESRTDRLKGEAIAEALGKEVGYRSVEYLGNNKFRVDYAMSGRLDRAFIYPLNTDAEAIMPWIAIEVRKDGTVRVKAPAFGEDSDNAGSSGAGAMKEAGAEREGSFTLTTDAELVMHNNEEGMAPGPGKKVVWKVTPTSKIVPTAVIRFAN